MNLDSALKFGLGCEPPESVSYQQFNSESVVSGVVLESGTNQPLKGIEVSLFHTTGKPIVRETNEGGEFYFSASGAVQLMPGKYFIQTAGPGHVTENTQQFWVMSQTRTVIKIYPLKTGWIRVCE